MKDNLPELGGSVVADLLSAMVKDLPMGNTIDTLAGGLFRQMHERRMEQARKIVIAEIADARRPLKDVHEADEIVAILYRYLEAARQGAARLNLLLMAKVLRGQFEREQLYASEFLRHAQLLSTLTREEVIFLGALHRNFSSKGLRDVYGRKAYHDTLLELAGEDPDATAEITAVASALQRTGLVVQIPSMTADSDGPAAVYCMPGPQLDKLVSLASLEEALRETEEA